MRNFSERGQSNLYLKINWQIVGSSPDRSNRFRSIKLFKIRAFSIQRMMLPNIRTSERCCQIWTVELNKSCLETANSRIRYNMLILCCILLRECRIICCEKAFPGRDSNPRTPRLHTKL